MTLISAWPDICGRAILIGDVRVTFVDGEGWPQDEIDGVQKIHPVARNAAAGFAGNVEAGFKLIRDLTVHLHRPDCVVKEPARLLLRWARRARFLWAQHMRRHERLGGCSLLFAAAAPPVAGTDVFPEAMVYRLRAPEFAPERVAKGAFVAIGAGGDVPAYTRHLAVPADAADLERYEIGPLTQTGGPAHAMAHALALTIDREPHAGISDQLVVCSILWAQVYLGFESTTAWGLGRVAPEGSPIARTLCQWRELALKHRGGATEAAAVA